MDQFAVDIKKPIRLPKQRLLKAGELERALDLAVQKCQGACGILILLDADEDCPREIGEQLMNRSNAVRPNANVQAVIAKAEYEAWLLGAAESLLPQHRRPLVNFDPRDAEEVRGAKEKLADVLGIFYSETVDQPALSSVFDLSQARANCPSFDKFWRVIQTFLEAD
ncbi:MAG: DUF4276 family protein [Candidatus Acidiferrum sp.]